MSKDPYVRLFLAAFVFLFPLLVFMFGGPAPLPGGEFNSYADAWCGLLTVERWLVLACLVGLARPAWAPVAGCWRLYVVCFCSPRHEDLVVELGRALVLGAPFVVGLGVLSDGFDWPTPLGDELLLPRCWSNGLSAAALALVVALAWRLRGEVAPRVQSESGWA